MVGETKRRLTTIVAADIAGFSRLVGIDEEGTLAAQRGHRKELIEPLLAEYHGRIANTAGDSFLFEFPSVVEAVRCLMAVQHGMAKRNRDIPFEHRIEYRTGINVGDVVSDGDDLFGDGVNIAARLEAICDPGGIILSDDAYRQVRDRLDIAWEDGGEHEVKNIARPVQIWRYGAIAEVNNAPSADVPLPLPDKPSIAVLPFDNMSGDPEQEYFSDGIAEDIITELSRFRWLFVIARNSSFTYKGRAVDVRQVGRELGVQYVLEGSVRKAGNRVRITAQLIDADTSNHIWAERYDRPLEDIFDLQDEITGSITAATGVELAGAEQERATRKQPGNLSAWDLCQRGMWHLWKWGDSDLHKAEGYLRQAIAADPNLAPAHAGLTYLLYQYVQAGVTDQPDEVISEGLQSGKTAIALDEMDAFAHFALGRIYMMRVDGSNAMGEIERSLQLNPNFPPALYAMGYLLLLLERGSEGIPYIDQALRLSPNDSLGWAFEQLKAWSLQTLGRLDEAELLFDKICRYPVNQHWPHTGKAALMSALDRMDEAGAALNIALELRPELTVSFAGQSLPQFHCEFRDQLTANLLKAGLPE